MDMYVTVLKGNREYDIPHNELQWYISQGWQEVAKANRKTSATNQRSAKASANAVNHD